MVVHGFLVRRSEDGIDERMLFEATPKAQLLLHHLNQKFDPRDYHLKINATRHSSSAGKVLTTAKRIETKERLTPTTLQGGLVVSG